MTDVPGDHDNTFRILVCTDTHTGYKERDRIRSSDSLVTLEEIFIIGKKMDVDLILHSGDLFDVAKPSKYIMYKVMNIIREYCMGSNKIKFKALSKRDSSTVSGYNWEIGDANVSIPLFGIHGNHDDPGEEGLLSPLDILESARFMNYIGKNSNIDDIEVSPVLLEKGTTRLAIYGIGNIRDERLYRSFERNKVKFMIPESVGDSGWFSILLFHQNRKKGNFGGTLSKDFIPESFLPDFLDLVIWGHEHECNVNPVEVINKNFFVLQPGSSIATSLISSESLQKHVILLEIKNNTFKTTPIPLLSPRIFIHDHIVLDKKITHVEKYLFEKVNELIERAKVKHIERKELNLPQNKEMEDILKNNTMELPIIRLRVEYECDSQLINSKRFGFQFVGKTANPHEILMFSRRNRNYVAPDIDDENPIGLTSTMGKISFNSDDSNMIESLTVRYTERLGGLDVINIGEFNKAIDLFVNKFDTHSIEGCIYGAVSKANLFYMNNKEDSIDEVLLRIKNNSMLNGESGTNKLDAVAYDGLSDSFSEGETSNSPKFVKQNKRSRENKNTTNRARSNNKKTRDGILELEWS
ncbi:DNA repair and meiosis protein [Cryptosporidium canis]|uniref:Double-strand break repair protein n=1 Tax=Cryptosporidium canis TaxID=195482 RepID=A0A9D5HYA1_9CRYT|nr:DNA repair and meiosis protein [Cryptosporidium canis]